MNKSWGCNEQHVTVVNNIVLYICGGGNCTHSSTLAWKIPWTEEPGRLQSMGSLRVGHDWTTSLSLFTFHFHALEEEIATHSSVLAWRIPGTGEPGGLPSMGSHRVGHDWSDLAAAAAGKNKLKQRKHMESAGGIIVNKMVTKSLADKRRNRERLEE